MGSGPAEHLEQLMRLAVMVIQQIAWFRARRTRREVAARATA